ncbi:gp53-like domain-containing protein [Pseudomonas chlororaphis]|uniref:gp53-like domain-containing protein n=1 Tax=Pseudomonas chlororaphis TaxID=587753 RepID=UPI0039E3C209
MDYPKSVPSVGLVNGQFVDENPIAGSPGSLIPASWGNAVTEELLSVIKAAGLNPNEDMNNQLLAALRGKELFDTAVQFDSSKKVATTEFVSRTLGSFAGSRGVTAATELTAADIGWSIGLGGVTGYTVTLPEVGSVPAGAVISLHNRNGAVITVAGKSNGQISPQGSSLNSISMSAGESASFVKEGSYWVVYGTAALKYSSAFSNLLATSGYQRLPGGMILQWGSALAMPNDGNDGGSAGVDLYVTFPMAFSNACFSVLGTHVGHKPSLSIIMRNISKTRFTAESPDMNPQAFNYIAVGC